MQGAGSSDTDLTTAAPGTENTNSNLVTDPNISDVAAPGETSWRIEDWLQSDTSLTVPGSTTQTISSNPLTGADLDVLLWTLSNNEPALNGNFV